MVISRMLEVMLKHSRVFLEMNKPMFIKGRDLTRVSSSVSDMASTPVWIPGPPCIMLPTVLGKSQAPWVRHKQ